MSAASRRRSKPLVFVDSNIMLCGMLRPGSPAYALLALAYLKKAPYRVGPSEFVRQEVERNLQSYGLVEQFHRMEELLNPHLIRLPTEEEVVAVRGWIRHQHDEPVLASALIEPRPRIIVSDNNKDFTTQLARRIGIPIMTAVKFMNQVEVNFTE